MMRRQFLRSQLTRREMMKLGLAGTGYLILGPDRNVSYADEGDLPSPYTTPFIDELPLPGITQDSPFPDTLEEYLNFWVDRNTTRFFKIVSEERWVNFHSELPPTAVWGYRDLSPLAVPTVGAGSLNPLSAHILGPTILQPFGTLGPPRNAACNCSGTVPVMTPVGGGFLVRHINCLPGNHRGFGLPRTTVHLHGGHHLARADGFPESIDNRPGNNGHPDIPDGFPRFIVMEPSGFVPPPDEPPTQYVETLADGTLVTDRQILDYYYPVLDPGSLDRIRGVSSEPADHTERPSTQWYHDHLLDFTARNAYRGLAGFVLCFDELDSNDENDPRDDTADPTVVYPKPLRLPSAPYDIPLAIQDKRFASDGRLVYSSFDHDGFLGDKFLVNGAIQPFLRVKRRKYRFRFLNASNARIYRLYLRDRGGNSFRMDQIATEGGLLSRPIRGITNFTLSMAERVEVVVDFGAYPFNQLIDGAEIFLENRLIQRDGRRPEDGLASRGAYLLKFILDGPPPLPDFSEVPDVLRPFDPISDTEKANAVRRTFRFDSSHGAWTINGKLAGHLEHPIATPRRGHGEIWTLVNNSGGWWHPIHIHSEFFRVLSRNGRTPPLAEQDGIAKKDTILLRDNESVEVFIKFRDHLGPFVFHCHNMEHEDMAMMARFDVVP